MIEAADAKTRAGLAEAVGPLFGEINRISDDVTWMETKIEAGEAIVDAALAVALGSRLDADCRSLLIGPWLRATEALR